MNTSIRVVLAEDHTLLRALLRSTLDASTGIEIVGEAATGAEAVRLVGLTVSGLVPDGAGRQLAFPFAVPDPDALGAC